MPVQTVGTRSSSPPHQLIPEQPGNEASMHTHIHIRSAPKVCTHVHIHTHTHFGITLQLLTASHSTPLHILPNPSLFMTITTGLLLSNTCVCMQSLDFGAQHTQVVRTCSSKQSQWEWPYCSWGVSMNEVGGV